MYTFTYFLCNRRKYIPKVVHYRRGKCPKVVDNFFIVAEKNCPKVVEFLTVFINLNKNCQQDIFCLRDNDAVYLLLGTLLGDLKVCIFYKKYSMKPIIWNGFYKCIPDNWFFCILTGCCLMQYFWIKFVYQCVFIWDSKLIIRVSRLWFIYYYIY